MFRSLVLLASAVGLTALGFLACSSSECSGATCGIPPVDAGPEVEDTGPTCNEAADPKDDPGCLDDTFGIFVDKTNGADSNAGTKASPLQSVGAAIAKLDTKKRIYICEGNYFEHVTIASKPFSLYGGFACKTWNYTGTKARFAPNDEGYLLQVALVTDDVTVSDIALESVNAQQPGRSSISTFITRSSNVILRRMTITAGAGAPGTDGVDGLDYDPPSAPDGFAGTDATEAGKPRQNPACGTSIGGAAGKDGAGSGRPGQVSISPAFPDKSTGAGGTGALLCSEGGAGLDGSFGLGGTAGTGATTFGTLDTTGWKGADGTTGGRGGDGQGGGGGAQITAPAIGGGGGPGGCGGEGGKNGTAGGSSIALLVFESFVALEGTSLVTKQGGTGGKGGKGQKAQLASTIPASPSIDSDACKGGLGGVGGSGGGGGGGAGGLSVAILYAGKPPSIEGTRTETADTLPLVTLGPAGAGGAKGLGGGAARMTAPVSKAGTDGTAGADGVAKALVAVVP